MLTADQIVILASGVTLLYFFIAEIYNLIKKRDWILLGILVIIIGLIGWIFYRSWDSETNKDETTEDNTKQNPINESFGDPEQPQDMQEPPSVPEDFKDLKKSFSFGLADTESRSEFGITYRKFKELYLTPDFLDKFHQAIRLSLQLKRKRYQELKIQFLQESKAFQGNKPAGIADIMSNLRNETGQSIRGAIKQIEEILLEIDKRLKTLKIETTRESLIKALTDPKDGLETLTGRDEVKDFLSLRLYTFAVNPRSFFGKFQNIPLYAGSGYGKTKIAKVIGHVYTCSGILIKGHFIQTTKAGLVSPFVNETAHKTRSVLLSTLESVLFIDEAYDITPPPNLLGHSVDHGQEAVTELVNFIDKMIGLNIIIVAGYEKEMEERFMQANEGLERRFLPPVILEPYNAKQLTSILIRFLYESNPELKLTQEHCDYIFSIMNWLVPKNLGRHEEDYVFRRQAGDMLNLSGNISDSINGTYDNVWPNNYQLIIRKGFNKFLEGKGISVKEESLR